MGAASTVYGRRETNEQNAQIERRLLFIGTAMTKGRAGHLLTRVAA
jgi:hypothetical protein